MVRDLPAFLGYETGHQTPKAGTHSGVNPEEEETLKTCLQRYQDGFLGWGGGVAPGRAPV